MTDLRTFSAPRLVLDDPDARLWHGDALADYAAFLGRKTQLEGMHGFSPVWLPDWLFPFQRALVAWALRKGRAASYYRQALKNLAAIHTESEQFELTLAGT